MGRAIDLLITYRVIKMLVTPFEKHKAYKLGIIDKDGKVLRKARTLKTAEERDSYTILHRFVFNMKRLINMIPGGKSKIGTYGAALVLLLRENKEINKEEIEKTLYKYLKDNNLLLLDDDLKENVGFDYLPKGRYTILDDLTDLEGALITKVGDVAYTTIDEKPLDTFFGTHLYKVINENTKKAITVSEDNIERIQA